MSFPQISQKALQTLKNTPTWLKGFSLGGLVMASTLFSSPTLAQTTGQALQGPADQTTIAQPAQRTVISVSLAGIPDQAEIKQLIVEGLKKSNGGAFELQMTFSRNNKVENIKVPVKGGTDGKINPDESARVVSELVQKRAGIQIATVPSVDEAEPAKDPKPPVTPGAPEVAQQPSTASIGKEKSVPASNKVETAEKKSQNIQTALEFGLDALTSNGELRLSEYGDNVEMKFSKGKGVFYKHTSTQAQLVMSLKNKGFSNSEISRILLNAASIGGNGVTIDTDGNYNLTGGNLSANYLAVAIRSYALRNLTPEKQLADFISHPETKKAIKAGKTIRIPISNPDGRIASIKVLAQDVYNKHKGNATEIANELLNPKGANSTSEVKPDTSKALQASTPSSVSKTEVNPQNPVIDGRSDVRGLVKGQTVTVVFSDSIDSLLDNNPVTINEGDINQEHIKKMNIGKDSYDAGLVTLNGRVFLVINYKGEYRTIKASAISNDLDSATITLTDGTKLTFKDLITGFDSKKLELIPVDVQAATIEREPDTVVFDFGDPNIDTSKLTDDEIRRQTISKLHFLSIAFGQSEGRYDVSLPYFTASSAGSMPFLGLVFKNASPQEKQEIANLYSLLSAAESRGIKIDLGQMPDQDKKPFATLFISASSVMNNNGQAVVLRGVNPLFSENGAVSTGTGAMLINKYATIFDQSDVNRVFKGIKDGDKIVNELINEGSSSLGIGGENGVVIGLNSNAFKTQVELAKAQLRILAQTYNNSSYRITADRLDRMTPQDIAKLQATIAYAAGRDLINPTGNRGLYSGNSRNNLSQERSILARISDLYSSFSGKQPRVATNSDTTFGVGVNGIDLTENGGLTSGAISAGFNLLTSSVPSPSVFGGKSQTVTFGDHADLSNGTTQGNIIASDQKRDIPGLASVLVAQPLTNIQITTFGFGFMPGARNTYDYQLTMTDSNTKFTTSDGLGNNFTFSDAAAEEFNFALKSISGTETFSSLTNEQKLQQVNAALAQEAANLEVILNNPNATEEQKVLAKKRIGNVKSAIKISLTPETVLFTSKVLGVGANGSIYENRTWLSVPPEYYEDFGIEIGVNEHESTILTTQNAFKSFGIDVSAEDLREIQKEQYERVNSGKSQTEVTKLQQDFAQKHNLRVSIMSRKDLLGITNSSLGLTFIQGRAEPVATTPYGSSVVFQDKNGNAISVIPGDAACPFNSLVYLKANAVPFLNAIKSAQPLTCVYNPKSDEQIRDQINTFNASPNVPQALAGISGATAETRRVTPSLSLIQQMQAEQLEKELVGKAKNQIEVLGNMDQEAFDNFLAVNPTLDVNEVTKLRNAARQLIATDGAFPLQIYYEASGTINESTKFGISGNIIPFPIFGLSVNNSVQLNSSASSQLKGVGLFVDPNGNICLGIEVDASSVFAGRNSNQFVLFTGYRPTVDTTTPNEPPVEDASAGTKTVDQTGLSANPPSQGATQPVQPTGATTDSLSGSTPGSIAPAPGVANPMSQTGTGSPTGLGTSAPNSIAPGVPGVAPANGTIPSTNVPSSVPGTLTNPTGAGGLNGGLGQLGSTTPSIPVQTPPSALFGGNAVNNAVEGLVTPGTTSIPVTFPIK